MQGSGCRKEAAEIEGAFRQMVLCHVPVFVEYSQFAGEFVRVRRVGRWKRNESLGWILGGDGAVVSAHLVAVFAKQAWVKYSPLRFAVLVVAVALTVYNSQWCNVRIA